MWRILKDQFIVRAVLLPNAQEKHSQAAGDPSVSSDQFARLILGDVNLKGNTLFPCDLIDNDSTFVGHHSLDKLFEQRSSLGSGSIHAARL